MTRQVAQALRELAKAYGYGQLGWPEYRAERRRLLDILFDPEQGDVTRPRGSDIPRVGSSISGGSIAPAAIPGTSREKKPTVAPEKPAELPRELAGASSDSASKRKGLPIVPLIAIAGAIVIAAVGVVVLTSQDKQATTTAAIATPDAAARDLIENFLTDNDWRDRRLDDLAEQWLALTPAERSAARSTPWKRDLENEIEDIIEELGAVGPLDNDEPVIRLARALGMNIPTTAAAPRPTAPDTTIQRPDELPAEAPPGQVVDAPGTSMAANDYDNADNNENLTAIDDLANELESTATSQTVAPSATDNSSIAEAVAEATPADTVTTPATEISDRPAQTPSTVAGIQTQSESVQANTTPAQTTPAATPAPPIPAESQPPTARATDRVCHAGLLGTRRPTCQDTLPGLGRGPRLAIVPAGRFQMGSVWASEEKPVRDVTVARPFALARREISHAEYLLYCGATGRTCPSSPWGGAEYPVVNVSWQDAADYAAWLSQQTGRQYRLPTEAEWEYAARAGQTTRYPGGDEPLLTNIRFDAASPMSANARVNANAFRLYHMAGNVREWVADAWHDNYETAGADAHAARSGGSGKVARGGCYADSAALVRLGSRLGMAATTRDDCTGFRVLRELDP